MTTGTVFALACFGLFASVEGAIALQAKPEASGHWVGTIAAGPGIDALVPTPVPAIVSPSDLSC